MLFWSNCSLDRTRAAIGLLIVLTLVGCGSEGGATGAPPASTGSVTIAVVTSGVRIDPDGYELTVGPASRFIGTNEVVQFSGIPVGTHPVTLSGAELNCAESDPRLASVTVQSNAPAQAQMDIECGYLVFVANHGSDDISVISTVTQSVVAMIEPGGVSAGLRITPNGERLYFGNLFRRVSHKVDAVSTTTFEIVAEVPVTHPILDIAISPDGAFGYALEPLQPSGGRIEVFDVLENTLVASIHVGGSPKKVVLTGDGRWTYVTEQVVDRLRELDMATYESSRATAIEAPLAVALSSDGSLVYVSRFFREDVLALQRSNFGIRAQASLGFIASDLQLSPDHRSRSAACVWH
jgi:YVTN family beta-propeller protein